MKTQPLHEMMRQQSALIKALATGKAVFGVQIIVEMNYNGYSFPHWAAEDQLEKLAGTLRKTLKRMRRYSQAKIYRWSELSDDEKRLLKERELPTLQEAPHGGTHTYLALNRTQDATALINGEEHLKLEVFEEVNKPLNMGDLFTEMIMLQAQLIDEISDTPACDDELLYLMSDPQKSGEGMSVAAWACLPAVVQTLGSQRVYQRIENAGLLVRPAFGARRESASDVFRIDIKPSGVTPLGDSLSALCATLKKLSADEMKQRKKLLTQTGSRMENATGTNAGHPANWRSHQRKRLARCAVYGPTRSHTRGNKLLKKPTAKAAHSNANRNSERLHEHMHR